jgi:hypothetical protein
MQNTKTMPTKSDNDVGMRGIVAQIARERNVNTNTVYLGLRRRSPLYMKRYVEIYEERKALQERFEQLYKKDVNNG